MTKDLYKQAEVRWGLRQFHYAILAVTQGASFRPWRIAGWWLRVLWNLPQIVWIYTRENFGDRP